MAHYCVLRGCCLNDTAVYCRSAFRGIFDPGRLDNELGLRLVVKRRDV